MAKNQEIKTELVIVESPTKVKTIEKYLGKKFQVQSSYGHVRDLGKQNKGIDIENDFAPDYIISEDKKKIIQSLEKQAKKSSCVWLATDDDREGEAISWHLYKVLSLEEKEVKRIVFREITKKAVIDSMKTPRDIDMNLVLAQQARRILDRLVGFELSPILWSKIQMGLSAGRVQSVALKLIVEREQEIDGFEKNSYFKISGNFFIQEGIVFKAELSKKIEKEQQVEEILEKCRNHTFSIHSITKKKIERNPSPPFTTSTLQQEASVKIGYAISQTMFAAQKLYEAGHITYMRTDSTQLSQQAKGDIKKKIEKLFNKEYYQQRDFKTKIKVAQEAHEAIRPTQMETQEVTSMGSSCDKLYKLIWIRTLASQMSSAKIERTTITIPIPDSELNFVAVGEAILFSGFLKAYTDFTKQSLSSFIKNLLPLLKENDTLQVENIEAIEKFTTPSPRYTEGSLVKKLEDLGVGRPSTYVPTITIIQKRKYVLKEDREGKQQEFTRFLLQKDKISKEKQTEIVGNERNKLFPTSTGMVVSNFLTKYFSKFINYSFTALIEEKFDAIANGNLKWNLMLKDFYKDFHQEILNIKEVNPETIGVKRELGLHPETQLPLIVKIGRYGPYIQMGENDTEKPPKSVSLSKDKLIDKITLEEAIEMFKLPRNIGVFEDEEAMIAIGPYGPYVKHKNKFYSLGKSDPHTISLTEAIEIIEEKRKKQAESHIQFFEKSDITILKGRYGPYIRHKKKNFKIPKGLEPKKLTEKECEEIIKQGGQNKKPRFK